MKTTNLLLLGAVGIGAYLLLAKKSSAAEGTGSVFDGLKSALTNGGTSANTATRTEEARRGAEQVYSTAQRVAENAYYNQIIGLAQQGVFSSGMLNKIANIPAEEWSRAIAEGGSSYLQPTSSGLKVVVSPEESSRNLETVRSEGGFTQIREGVYKKKTSTGTKVIYT